MSSQVAYHRSPCPGRIFEDLGVGFSIGCIGGSLFYFFKGKTPPSQAGLPPEGNKEINIQS